MSDSPNELGRRLSKSIDRYSDEQLQKPPPVRPRAEEDVLEIIKVGGLRGLCGILRKRSDHAEMMRASLKILAEVFLSHYKRVGHVELSKSRKKNKSSSDLLVEFDSNDGPQLLVAVMTRYLGNELIIHNSLKLISIITRVDVSGATTISLTNAHLLPVLQDIMADHTENESIILEACSALSSMISSGKEDMREVAAHFDFLGYLFDAIDEFPNSVETIKEALLSIQFLVMSDAVAFQLVENSDFLYSLLDLIQHRQDLQHNEHIQAILVTILYNISLVSGTRKYMTTKDVLEALLGLINANMHIEQAMFEAFSTLALLTAKDNSIDSDEMIAADSLQTHEQLILCLDALGAVDICRRAETQYNSKEQKHLLRSIRQILKVLASRKVAGRGGILEREVFGSETFARADKLGGVAVSLIYVVFLWMFVQHSLLTTHSGATFGFVRDLQAAVLEEPYLVSENFGLHSSIDKHAARYRTFGEITSAEDIWNYLETLLIPTLFPTHWYNGELRTPEEQGYVLNYNRLVGDRIRLRQLRVKNGSCDVDELMKGPAYDRILNSTAINVTRVNRYENGSINHCFSEYSSTAEDTSAFRSNIKASINYPWTDPTKSNSTIPSYWGKLGRYHGGGYIVELGRNATLSEYSSKGKPCNVSCTVEKLREDRWIDLSTRVMFVEFTLYNPAVDGFCLVILSFELGASGGVVASYTFRPFQRHYQSSNAYLLEFLLLGFYVWTMFTIRKGNLSWNILHMIVWTSVLCIRLVLWIMLMIEDDKLEFSAAAFNHSALVEWEHILNSVNAMFIWMRLLVYYKWIPAVQSMSGYFNRVSVIFRTSSLFYILLLLSFGHFAYLIFQNYLHQYRDFPQAILTVYRQFFQSFDYENLARVNRLVGPFYWVFFGLVRLALVLNYFAIIACNTYNLYEMQTKSSFALVQMATQNQYAKLKKLIKMPSKPRTTHAKRGSTLKMIDTFGGVMGNFEQFKEQLASPIVSFATEFLTNFKLTCSHIRLGHDKFWKALANQPELHHDKNHHKQKQMGLLQISDATARVLHIVIVYLVHLTPVFQYSKRPVPPRGKSLFEMYTRICRNCFCCTSYLMAHRKKLGLELELQKEDLELLEYIIVAFLSSILLPTEDCEDDDKQQLHRLLQRTKQLLFVKRQLNLYADAVNAIQDQEHFLLNQSNTLQRRLQKLAK